MFLSSGNIVESIGVDRKSFGKILAEYISRGFSGRISYRNDRGVYISIEIIRGSIALCRGIERGNIVEGSICCEKAASYLHVGEGVVEVMEIDPKLLDMDFIVYPNSVVESTTVLHRELEAIATTLSRAIEAPPKVIPSKEILQPVVVEECIDPILLYQIVRSSQLLQQIDSSIYLDIIRNIMDISREKRYSRIYVSATTDSGTLRILLDVESMNIAIEYDERGKTLCGSNAIEKIKHMEFKSIRIWAL